MTIPKNEILKYLFPRLHIYKGEGGYGACTVVKMYNREPKEVIIDIESPDINTAVEKAATDAQYWLHQDILASEDLLISPDDLYEVFGTMIGNAKMEGLIKYLKLKSDKKKKII